MARVAAPFGIKGWVKLQVFTESPDSLDAYANWFLRSSTGWESFELEDFAVNVKAVVAKFKGIDDRTAAERICKRDIGIPRDALDELEDGEVYWADLVGCEVIDTLGKSRGRIEGLMETGANDVLVVRSEKNAESTEILIPFVDEYLANVDRQNKVVTVRWERHWQENDSKDGK